MLHIHVCVAPASARLNRGGVCIRSYITRGIENSDHNCSLPPFHHSQVYTYIHIQDVHICHSLSRVKLRQSCEMLQQNEQSASVLIYCHAAVHAPHHARSQGLRTAKLLSGTAAQHWHMLLLSTNHAWISRVQRNRSSFSNHNQARINSIDTTATAYKAAQGATSIARMLLP